MWGTLKNIKYGSDLAQHQTYEAPSVNHILLAAIIDL